MNVIWVAQDNKKDGSFKQTKAEILCTISCVLFIKHYYPKFKTNLFVDNHTFKYYEQFGVLDMFDNVDNSLLNQDLGVNLDVYWAAGKIFAQNTFNFICKKKPKQNLFFKTNYYEIFIKIRNY